MIFLSLYNLVSRRYVCRDAAAEMDALVWSVVIPTGLYITRGLGSGVQTALRQPVPENLATDVLDVDGALASADCALRFYPVSPTADHLRNLVSRAKANLENLLVEAEERRDRAGFLRLFRDPDFAETNRLLRASVETLKSRVHLYLLVVNIFPEKFPKEDNRAFEKAVNEQGQEINETNETNELQYYGVEYAGVDASSARCTTEGRNEEDSVKWANMVALVPGLSSFMGSPAEDPQDSQDPQDPQGSQGSQDNGGTKED